MQLFDSLKLEILNSHVCSVHSKKNGKMQKLKYIIIYRKLIYI